MSLTTIPWDIKGKCCVCHEQFLYADDLISHILKLHTADTDRLRKIYRKSCGSYKDQSIQKEKCGEPHCTKYATTIVESNSVKGKTFRYRFCYGYWREIYIKRDLNKQFLQTDDLDLTVMKSVLEYWIDRHAFHASQAQIKLLRRVIKARNQLRKRNKNA